MKITGELLKSERIKLKLSQQDIAFALKLSPRTINAIEEGDVEVLPAKTFIRGFVKSYAEMLKLDSALVLSQFHEEMGTTRPVAPVTKNLTVTTEAEPSKVKAKVTSHAQEAAPKNEIASVTPNLKSNLNKTTLKLVALITFAVIVLGGINEIINKYQREVSKVPPENPKLTVESLTQEAHATKEIAANSAAPGQATGAVDSAPTTTTTDGPINQASPSTIVAQQKPVENALAENKEPEILVSTKSVELVIEATKDTIISYSVGNENNYKTLSLKKNTFQIIKSKNGLHLNADEGNSISITVNGINKGLASSDAKPVKLSF